MADAREARPVRESEPAWDDFDDGTEPDEEDELENAMDDCGSTGRGQCMLAGTEYCDFECPFRNEMFGRRHQA